VLVVPGALSREDVRKLALPVGLAVAEDGLTPPEPGAT
jgi:hypothetical protein